MGNPIVKIWTFLYSALYILGAILYSVPVKLPKYYMKTINKSLKKPALCLKERVCFIDDLLK